MSLTSAPGVPKGQGNRGTRSQIVLYLLVSDPGQGLSKPSWHLRAIPLLSLVFIKSGEADTAGNHATTLNRAIQALHRGAESRIWGTQELEQGSAFLSHVTPAECIPPCTSASHRASIPSATVDEQTLR